MKELEQWFYFSPVATISALIFYAFFFLNLSSPLVRKYFKRFFAYHHVGPNLQITSLDSLRGLAASIVVLSHIWYFCYPIFNATQIDWFRFLSVGGNKAVPIFSILSGFLIYRSVKNILTLEDFKNYLHRRFLRIYPVYIFTITLSFLLGLVPFTLSQFLSSIFMFNIFSFGSGYMVLANPPAWSLYVEILFYLLLPVWVIFFKSRILSIAFVTFGLLVFVDSLTPRESWLWKYFFVGIFLSELVFIFKDRISEKIAISAFFIGFILLWMDFKLDQNGQAYFDWFNLLCPNIIPKNLAEYTVGLALAMFLVMFGIIFSPKLAKFWSIKSLRMLGIVSYSLYLIHPFFIWAVFPKLRFELHDHQSLIDPIISAPAWYLPLVMFPGCLAWGIIVHILVEKPFLFRMNRRRQESANYAQKETLLPAING